MSRKARLAAILAVALASGCERAPQDASDQPAAAAPISAPDPAAPLAPITWPAIPATLQGCWRSDDPDMPEHEIEVTADSIAMPAFAGGVPARTGRTELVNSVTATAIDGRFTAIEDGRPLTVASGLELASEHNGAPPGSMILREGDAGSYRYVPCQP